ncbi:hypothetical protein TrST_g6215 [Triparma strigata]|uniref:non-specific serine/threonine protein kinase n=1 Tax=Triparma strigata TaxID=1606541 RepID=A0A9W7BE77_9STRA|nr:hypothetical protein TrST_g6215 [Triparma strigata]
MSSHFNATGPGTSSRRNSHSAITPTNASTSASSPGLGTSSGPSSSGRRGSSRPNSRTSMSIDQIGDAVARRRGSRQMSNPSSPRMQPKVKDTSRKFVLDLGRQLDCGPIDPTKYETLKHIGRGAFGSVHLIKSRKENNLFALKTMSYGDQENRTHVQREIQLLIKLMHPFVIALYDLYTEGDSAKAQTMNLVMTYCDGGDLSKLIKTVRKNLDSMDASQHKDKLYSPQNFLRWFCMSCLSLDYLHSNQILHRDIKPDNIFLSASSKNCRLGDFGLAKQLGSDEDVVKTEVGTTYYISPEIVSNKGYSYPTDVWSLGCVMYELVTLNLPYYGDNLTAFVDSLM